MLRSGLKARGSWFSWFTALGFLIVVLAAPHAGQAQVTTTEPEAAPQVDVTELTAQERVDLLSRLSDEQVRDLMLVYMRETAAPQAEETPVIEEIHRGIAQFRERFGARLSGIDELVMVPGFVYAQLAEGRSDIHPLIVVGIFVLITLIAYGAQLGYRWVARGLYDGLMLPPDAEPLPRLGRLLARLVLDLVGVAVFAIAIMAMFFILYQGHEPTRLAVMTLLTAVVIVAVASVVSRLFFAPYAPSLRIAPFDDQTAAQIHRWIIAVTAITAFGILICGLMLNLGLPLAHHELVLQLVGIVVVVVLIIAAFRLHRPVAAALTARLQGDGLRQRIVGGLLSYWHIAFIAYVLFVFALSTYERTVGGDTGAYPGLVSLLIVLLLPAADFFLRSVLDHFFPTAKSAADQGLGSALPVFKRAIRILLFILAVFLLGDVWGVNFFALGEGSFGEEIMRAIIDIALTLLVAYVAWGAIKASLARYLTKDGDESAGGDEGGASGATRLQTVMPLVMRFIQISIAVIVVMILLSSLGVDIGPLLAGAGVIGLALGFGAQSLVRDVVSGLFFLMDDAFRKGEYVDIGSVKGTVESINIRSLVLRHHLGTVHTVPYGEIQHLSNFSRDWVIVKMEFRVPTDTDINKVKKLFKQIGAAMLEDPVFGEDFLEPFKSQGVKSIEDSAIIVRGKFMAKPGKQFVIRKELYNRVQKAFHENGIDFAHRKVTVELPSDVKLTDEQADNLSKAAGAAALAAEEEELAGQGKPATL